MRETLQQLSILMAFHRHGERFQRNEILHYFPFTKYFILFTVFFADNLDGIKNNGKY